MSDPLQSDIACTQTHRTITSEQLPLCCPLPEDPLWNAHPRVYLPIETAKTLACPYCGTIYTLLDTPHT